MKNVIEALNWRYATKKYDPAKKLSAEQIETLLEAARLAPTSFGLQPIRLVNVTDPAIRAKLRTAAHGQSAVTDASHFVVFAATTDLGPKQVEEFTALVAATRNVPIESLADYNKMIGGTLASRTAEQNTDWAAKQAYIALGILLLAAAENEIDATPMEGFDAKQFTEILGLAKLGLTAVVAAAIGFRAEDDSYIKLTKVRFPKEKFIIGV